MAHQKLNMWGQSAVEFALLAPVLFLLFFGILQLAYTGLVAFAVQRAAASLAREYSLTGKQDDAESSFEIALALAPLAALNQATLAALTGAHCDFSYSPDRRKARVRVTCSIPVWVPLVGKIFGKKMEVLPISKDSKIGASLQSTFALLGLPAPNLSFSNFNAPYAWTTTFEASVYNEGYSALTP